jgi:hypothetical protein
LGSTVLPEETLLPNDEYNEVFRENPDTGGIAIKMLRRHKVHRITNKRIPKDIRKIIPHFILSLAALPCPPAGSQVRDVDASTDLVLSLC